MERLGKPVGANALLIAAHALMLALTLVTDNVEEFVRIPSIFDQILAQPGCPDMNVRATGKQPA